MSLIGSGRRRGLLTLDEDTAKGVTDLTGETYYSAEGAGKLNDAFASLSNGVTLQTRGNPPGCGIY